MCVIDTLMTFVKAYGLTLELSMLLHFRVALILTVAVLWFGLYDHLWSILATETQVL